MTEREASINLHIARSIWAIPVDSLHPNVNRNITVRAGNVTIHASNMGTHGPFNRAVRDDMAVRDAARVEQVRARRAGRRAFEEALVLKGTVHLVPDLVRR